MNAFKTVGKVENFADSTKSISKIADNVHGNSLLTTKPAYGYSLTDKTTGDVLKYGETIHPKTRYSQTYLNNINADLNKLASGTKREMHYWQHDQILNYMSNYGVYPPMNFNGW